MKIYKDMLFNRTIVEKLDEENSKYNNGNYKLLGNIIKEKEKYYFDPLLIDLGNDKENINDVPWLIYNNKVYPEINDSYILKEGDIIKMGNVIFQIKMIQINENESNENKNDIESNNNTLLISGSANHSLILNNNYEGINVTSKKLNINIKSSTNINSQKNKTLSSTISAKNEKINKKTKICRICYQDEDDNLLNPLIRPCKCSGSMKYIHLKCLLHWLKSRTSNNPSINNTNSNNNFNAYFINQRTECELCKQLFPDYIKHNDIKYCLIDFDYAQEYKIKENNIAQNYINTNMENNIMNSNNNTNTNNKNNFIVLDTIFPLSDSNKYRYIVKFNENNEMKIGRGLDNQLVLNEITVSRNHCILTLQKNKYGNYEIKMEDDNSKFGTLILVQTDKIEIIKGKPLHLQISNVHLILEIKKKNSLLSCCNAEVVDEKKTYEKMNYRAVRNKNIVNILTEDNSDDGENEKEENKNNSEKDITDNKKKEGNNKILLLSNNNADSILNQKDNANMKTIPKETCDKKDNSEKNDNKDNDNKDDDNNDNDNKDDDNKEDKNKNKENNHNNNDSVEVEEDV